MRIDVILVDDHEMVREGLSSLLAGHPDLRVVASFGEAAAALAFCAAEPPQVAIVDVALPGLDGIEAAKRIHDACPSTQVLMLSMHAGPEHIYQALRAGANGYVLKESAGTELVEAIRAVHAGRLYLSEKIRASGFEEYFNAHADHPLERISPRERQVLKLIVDGHTSNEVGALLGLSPKSVDTYRSRIMLKLRIDDLPGLVKFAIRHGITTV